MYLRLIAADTKLEKLYLLYGWVVWTVDFEYVYILGKFISRQTNKRMQWKQCFNRSNYKFKSSSSPKKILKVLS